MKVQHPPIVPRVRDLMQTRVLSVLADMRTDDLAHALTEKRISGAPVIDANNNVIGVVTLTDLAMAAAHPQRTLEPNRASTRYYRDLWMEEELSQGFMVEDYGSQQQVQDIMTPVVHQVHQDDSLIEVVNLMLAARIHRAFVTDGEDIIGIVTTMDLIKVIPQLISALANLEKVAVRQPA